MNARYFACFAVTLATFACAPSHGRRIFDKLDSNHDAKVTEAEFVSHVNSEAFRVLDANADGQITFAEWTEKEARRTSTSLFKAMDSNHDGALAPGEFRAKSGSRKHDELKSTFHTLDRNQDGGLEWDEVVDSQNPDPP